MGTLSKALVYLATVPIGIALVFFAAALLSSPTEPCPAPCDAPAMGLFFLALFLGPLLGLLLGYLLNLWLDSKHRAQRRG